MAQSHLMVIEYDLSSVEYYIQGTQMYVFAMFLHIFDLLQTSVVALCFFTLHIDIFLS